MVADLDAFVLREALPSAMLTAPRWLLHDARKIPYYVDGTPRNGTLDSAEDTGHLARFDDAFAALAKTADRFAGIGFALGDGWQGIDLDKHRDPDSGALTPLAERIVDECGSYAEISPSGRGVHIVGHGAAFAAIGAAATGRRIEAYAGARYFTVTGRALRNAGELADIRPVVERLRAKFVRGHDVEQGPHKEATLAAPLLEKLRGVKATSKGWVACCPAHDDNEPSLSVREMSDRVLLHCHAGCKPDAIVRAVGLTMDALFRKREKPTDILDYVFADEIKDDTLYGDDLVEGLIERGKASVVYGDSNSGKTFLVVDIAAAIARTVHWMGRNVEGGLVIYLAAESPGSIEKRLAAYRKHHRCKVPNFVIVRSPIDLFNGDSDTRLVVELVHKIERDTGRKCEIVIGDTLSRLSTGANENSGEDMSIVVRHVDRIRQECAVHFMLIHHCGKNAALGMRGWSGLRAATDTEIEVTDSDGARSAEITKQRDIGGKGERIGFRLEVVPLGIGKWGKPITSCVVVSAEAPAKPSGKRPSAIEGAIIEFLTARGSGIKKRELATHFEGRYPDTSVYREIRKLVTAKKLHEAVGIVALAS